MFEGIESVPERAGVVVTDAIDSDRPDWQGFVLSHPEATFFHRFEWRELLARQWGHEPRFLIARQAGEVVGILPLAHVRSMVFGSSLVSLPFCVYGGPLTTVPQALGALDARADELARAAGAAHIEYRSRERGHADWPTTDLYVTFRKPLSADEDANLKAIPRKQRAMVRKGLGNGLTAGIEDVDSFFPLYADNVHRHGTPGMPLSWFKALSGAFGEDCETLIVRDAQGKPQSAVVCFYFRGEAMPYYAGDFTSARDLAANDFKYWQLMCHSVRRGCSLFDYGRSKVGTGPYAFKRNWGFEPSPLAYEYRLLTARSVPQNNPANPKYRLMIETWRRLPRPIVNWLGPRVVRALG